MRRSNHRAAKLIFLTLLWASWARIGHAQSPYCRSGLNVAIPDTATSQTPGTPATDTQTIADTQVLTDANLSLHITHTWVGDLVVNLNKISGPGSPLTVSIITRPGCNNVGEPANGGNAACGFGCSGDNILATFDDAGSDGDLAASCTAGLNAGPYLPRVGTLSALNGIALNGDWQISVTDWGAGDTGTILEWCILTTPLPVELTGFEVD